MTPLNLLCAGAAKGLVTSVQERFGADNGATLRARFGPVGVMKEALLAGEPCDVMIVTEAMVQSLAADGQLRGETRRPLGRVHTGIAVRSDQMPPDVSTPEALREALRAADALYFPDPLRATAGIHFAGVLKQLGVFDELQGRLHSFASGAVAMRELAASRSPRAIGCTQVTEVLYTPGVQLVGRLPPRFELATVYTAAVSAHAAEPALAARFIELVAGPASRAVRAAGGFEAGEDASCAAAR
jgi:molybdate transport system substrate-binding protein